MFASDDRRLMAVFYDDGIAADRFISELGYGLRKHIAVRGLVQRNTFRRDRVKCDMELEELGSGQIFQLSRDRGKFSGGCRLDREAIVEASRLLLQGLESCDVLIINKFGRTEAEGRGLREVIGEAAGREIATIVGVPRRNSNAWQEFAGDLSDRCEIGEADILLAWLRDRIVCRHSFPYRNMEIEPEHLFLSELAPA